MGIDDAVFLLILFIVILVPVLGITARITLKPIVESILRLREGFTVGDGVVARRGLQLQEEVKQLRTTVDSLEETVAFQQKLLANPAATPAPSAATDGG